MGTIKTTNIETITGSGTLTLGQSGETISIPSGATFTNNGVMSGQNYPAFEAYLSSDQTISNFTYTTVNADTEVYDTDNAYNTSTYKFTPQVAGKYFVYGSIGMESTASNTLDTLIARIYKNSSIIPRLSVFVANTSALEVKVSLGCTGIIDMNGSTDNICFQGYIGVSSGTPFFESSGFRTYFGAYRIGS